MNTVGIICEYNPFHAGHLKQIARIRSLMGPDTGVVCLMSGNFVQRGEPAVIDKSLRAKAAVVSGADLVLELPPVTALSSAEGFAAGGVRILETLCSHLCFGAETDDPEQLLKLARALLSDSFPVLLRRELEKGLSFPAARQAALEAMRLDGSLLTSPNNILATEYCKAIYARQSPLIPLPILRGGDYHAAEADADNPSATSLRALMLEGRYWKSYIPGPAAEVFEGAALHSLQAGQRAVLGKLRTMTDEEFEALPYGSEGLWRKFMANCRRCPTLEQILTETKSKRYTRSRLNRMMMCAFLGLTAAELQETPPYVRVLAFNDRGRAILRDNKKNGVFLNAGEIPDTPWGQMETRMGDLYGLFALDGPEPPGIEENRRIFYQKQKESL